MTAKTIKYNRIKNLILNNLNTSNRLETVMISELSKKSNLDFDLLYVLSEQLESKEYLTAELYINKDGQDKMIIITRKGKLFIKEGGYPSSFFSATMNAINNNKATIISVIAVIISVFSYFKN